MIGGEPKAEYVLRDVYDWGAEARTGSDRERPAVIATEIGTADVVSVETILESQLCASLRRAGRHDATWDLLDARKLAPEHLLGKTPALDAHHKQVAQLVCKQIQHTRALSEHASHDLRCDDAALIWLHPGTRHRCIDAYCIQYSWPSCFLAISSSIDTRLIRHGRTARSGRQSCHRTRIGEQRSVPVARDAPLANFRSG